MWSEPSSGSWQAHRIVITKPAEKHLRELSKKLGKSLFQQVANAIKELEYDPEGKTQGLAGELAPYRSLHVNRCRVVVKISELHVTVYVVAAGWHTSGDRDDIYQRFRRMLQNKGDGVPAKPPSSRPPATESPAPESEA